MRLGHASNKTMHQYVGKESLQAALAAADRVNMEGKMIWCDKSIYLWCIWSTFIIFDTWSAFCSIYYYVVKIILFLNYPER